VKKKIEDPSRPEGFYYGYESIADCMKDYETDCRRRGSTEAESITGYACLWVFLAAIVILSIIAGVFQW
jgi:hypothetical protein